MSGLARAHVTDAVGRARTIDRLVSGVAAEFSNVHTAILLNLAELVAAAASSVSVNRTDLDDIAHYGTRGAQLARFVLASLEDVRTLISGSWTFEPQPGEA